MTKYSVIEIYKSEISDTCNHCNRAIKNIAVVRNNLTGETLKVGLTCLENLLNITESFSKLVVKESNKLIKLQNDLNSWNEALENVEDVDYNIRRFEALCSSKVDGWKYTNKSFSEWYGDVEKHREHRQRIIDTQCIPNVKKQQIKINKLSKLGLLEL